MRRALRLSDPAPEPPSYRLLLIWCLVVLVGGVTVFSALNRPTPMVVVVSTPTRISTPTPTRTQLPTPTRLPTVTPTLVTPTITPTLSGMDRTAAELAKFVEGEAGNVPAAMPFVAQQLLWDYVSSGRIDSLHARWNGYSETYSTEAFDAAKTAIQTVLTGQFTWPRCRWVVGLGDVPRLYATGRITKRADFTFSRTDGTEAVQGFICSGSTNAPGVAK